MTILDAVLVCTLISVYSPGVQLPPPLLMCTNNSLYRVLSTVLVCTIVSVYSPGVRPPLLMYTNNSLYGVLSNFYYNMVCPTIVF